MIPTAASPSSQSSSAPPVGRRVLVNAGALAGSSLWRIVVSFALQLLIARILGVADLGLYAVALAYLNVAQVFSELGLPTLLVRDLAHDPPHRRGYYLLALRVQVVAAFLVWGALILLTLLLPYSADTRTVLWLVGASLPLYAVTSASETLFQAGERMEYLMAVEVTINTLIVVMSVVVLWSGGGVLQLVGVLIVTQAISALLCVWLVLRNRLFGVPQEPIQTTWRSLWQRSSPFYGVALVDVLLQRMDIILLSVFGGVVITGVYTAAYNLVRVLIKLTQSFWQAIYPTLSRLYHLASYKYATLSALSMRYGLILLLPSAALCTGVAVDLLHLIYAEGYAESAAVLQRLVWLAPVLFVEIYAVIHLMIEHHPTEGLFVTGVHLVALVILVPLFTRMIMPNDGAIGAAWAALVAGLLGAASGALRLRYRHISFGLARLGPVALATAVAFALSMWFPAPWPLRVLAGALAYIALLWITGALAIADIRLFQRSLRAGEM
jgi:O-antigen/teichoic acid export membrane protein